MSRFETPLLLIIAVLLGLWVSNDFKEPTPIPSPNPALQQELNRRTVLLSHVFGTNMASYNEYFTPVTVTAYSACEAECNADPEHTSSGQLSRTNIVALSRDMFDQYGLQMGDTIIIYIEGVRYGAFQVEDKMSTHKFKGTPYIEPITNTVDILMGNARAAELFGVHDGVITWVKSQKGAK